MPEALGSFARGLTQGAQPFLAQKFARARDQERMMIRARQAEQAAQRQQQFAVARMQMQQDFTKGRQEAAWFHQQQQQQKAQKMRGGLDTLAGMLREPQMINWEKDINTAKKIMKEHGVDTGDRPLTTETIGQFLQTKGYKLDTLGVWGRGQLATQAATGMARAVTLFRKQQEVRAKMFPPKAPAAKTPSLTALSDARYRAQDMTDDDLRAYFKSSSFVTDAKAAKMPPREFMQYMVEASRER